MARRDINTPSLFSPLTDPPIQWVFNWDVLMSTVTGVKRSAPVVYVSLVYVLPGVIMLTAYLKIFVVVRRHRRAVAPSPNLLTWTGLAPAAGAGPCSIYGLGASAAKKLFIIYFVYWLMYDPITVTPTDILCRTSKRSDLV